MNLVFLGWNELTTFHRQGWTVEIVLQSHYRPTMKSNLRRTCKQEFVRFVLPCGVLSSCRGSERKRKHIFRKAYAVSGVPNCKCMLEYRT